MCSEPQLVSEYPSTHDYVAALRIITQQPVGASGAEAEARTQPGASTADTRPAPQVQVEEKSLEQVRAGWGVGG